MTGHTYVKGCGCDYCKAFAKAAAIVQPNTAEAITRVPRDFPMKCAICGEPRRNGVYEHCQVVGPGVIARKACSPAKAGDITYLPNLTLTESERRKRTPVYSGVMRYFPDALQSIARVSWKGNEKHNPGQPLHWSRGKSNDHADCVVRHLLTPDEIDPESGETHLAHAAWRVLALLQLQQEKLKGKP